MVQFSLQTMPCISLRLNFGDHIFVYFLPYPFQLLFILPQISSERTFSINCLHWNLLLALLLDTLPGRSDFPLISLLFNPNASFKPCASTTFSRMHSWTTHLAMIFILLHILTFTYELKFSILLNNYLFVSVKVLLSYLNE